jgi:hypothetical protein
MIQKKTKYFLSLFICILFFASTGYADAAGIKYVTQQLKTQKAVGKTSLLFFQQADKATFKKTSKNCYLLTLSGSHQKILFFSETPQKIVGTLTSQEFISLWKSKHKRLNVVIQGFAPNNQHYVLTLSAPNYSHGKFCYNACLTDAKRQDEAVLPATLQHPNMFIDNLNIMY